MFGGTASSAFTSGECGRAEGELFVSGRKPWCDPNVGGTAREVTEVCERCPTGALTYIRKDGGPAETAPARNLIVVANDGPLFVTGDLAIDAAAADQPGLGFRAALCRCGASNNKPFCDNRHREIHFADHGAVGSKGEAASETGGKLQIRRAPNGPLLLNGNFTIIAGSGRGGLARHACSPVPLRRLEEQAVLRRQPQARRLHGRVNGIATGNTPRTTNGLMDDPVAMSNSRMDGHGGFRGGGSGGGGGLRRSCFAVEGRFVCIGVAADTVSVWSTSELPVFGRRSKNAVLALSLA